MEEYVECDWCKQIKGANDLKMVTVMPEASGGFEAFFNKGPKGPIKRRVCQDCIDTRNRKIKEGRDMVT